MLIYANARALNSALGQSFCNRYITGLTESMSCVVPKPCWLQLKWGDIVLCKRRQFEQDQCSNACLSYEQCSILHYVDMAPLLCFHGEPGAARPGEWCAGYSQWDHASSSGPDANAFPISWRYLCNEHRRCPWQDDCLLWALVKRFSFPN